LMLLSAAVGPGEPERPVGRFVILALTRFVIRPVN
jgi:hypothetical protein